MMGADAGAELGNGEHVATGGVFEGFGIEMKDESPSAGGHGRADGGVVGEAGA